MKKMGYFLDPFWARLSEMGGGKIKEFVWFVFYFILLWWASKFSLQAFGEKPHTVQTLAVCIFASIFCSHKKTFRYLILPLSVIVGLYAPIGLLYGKPSYQFVVSLFATSLSEASEFLSQFPVECIVKGVAIPTFSVLAYLVATRSDLRPWRNKTYVFLAVAILVLCGRPTPFFDTLKTAFMQVESENDELQKIMKKSSWRGVESKLMPRDYVLVIGESVRRDYLNIYSYSIKNTPYLSNSNKITIVDGLFSAAPYTAGSLRLMLTYPVLKDKEWEPRYDFNLVGLAKAAGFRTAWFSNQGYAGIDTPVTAIAKSADKTLFVTGGEFTASTASDFVLLPMLQSELEQEFSGSRLIVLHTIGSHSLACERIKDMPYVYVSSDDVYEELACYVSSLRKMDKFIEKTASILDENQIRTGRPYSILWFSDHGQTQVLEDGKYRMRHGEKSNSNFDVPLIKIDSDAMSKKYIKSKKSGLCFACGLAGWMGIETDSFKRCDLFDGKDDPDYMFEKRTEITGENMQKDFDLKWIRVSDFD